MDSNLLSRSQGSNTQLTKSPRAMDTAGLNTQQILHRLQEYKQFIHGPHNEDHRESTSFKLILGWPTSKIYCRFYLVV